MATERQISFITDLAQKAGYDSNIDAINAYGLGLRTARDLSVSEASEMIDFLTGKPHRATIEPQTSVQPVKVGRNKGGRVGQNATTKSGTRGTVVSDAGKKVRLRFVDGSIGSYDPAALTFDA